MVTRADGRLDIPQAEVEVLVIHYLFGRTLIMWPKGMMRLMRRASMAVRRIWERWIMMAVCQKRDLRRVEDLLRCLMILMRLEMWVLHRKNLRMEIRVAKESGVEARGDSEVGGETQVQDPAEDEEEVEVIGEVEAAGKQEAVGEGVEKTGVEEAEEVTEEVKGIEEGEAEAGTEVAEAVTLKLRIDQTLVYPKNLNSTHPSKSPQSISYPTVFPLHHLLSPLPLLRL